MDASPEVLRSMEGAPDIHDRLTRYMITPYGGKLNPPAATLIPADDLQELVAPIADIAQDESLDIDDEDY